MGNLFSLKLWTNIRPGSLQPGFQTSLVIFVFIMLVLTVIFNLLKNKKRTLYNKIWQKLATFSVTNFIIGVLLLFFTYELIPFLSMRFWFLLWGLGILIWIYYIIKAFIKIPEIKEKIAKEEEFKKYIP